MRAGWAIGACLAILFSGAAQGAEAPARDWASLDAAGLVLCPYSSDG